MTGVDKAVVMAAGQDDVKELQKLIKKEGVNLDAYYKDKTFASQRTPLLHACATQKYHSIKALLEAKADVNKGNPEGRTPLMVACCLNDTEMAKILLEAGADVKSTRGNVAA